MIPYLTISKSDITETLRVLQKIMLDLDFVKELSALSYTDLLALEKVIAHFRKLAKQHTSKILTLSGGTDTEENRTSSSTNSPDLSRSRTCSDGSISTPVWLKTKGVPCPSPLPSSGLPATNTRQNGTQTQQTRIGQLFQDD